jgi:hypothetical protein
MCAMGLQVALARWDYRVIDEGWLSAGAHSISDPS